MKWRDRLDHLVILKLTLVLGLSTSPDKVEQPPPPSPLIRKQMQIQTIQSFYPGTATFTPGAPTQPDDTVLDLSLAASGGRRAQDLPYLEAVGCHDVLWHRQQARPHDYPCTAARIFHFLAYNAHPPPVASSSNPDLHQTQALMS